MQKDDDLWSAGRIIQYLLITIAIAAIGYTGSQMRGLAITMNNIEGRLTKLETNVSGLVTKRLDDFDYMMRDHEVRIRKLEQLR